MREKGAPTLGVLDWWIRSMKAERRAGEGERGCFNLQEEQLSSNVATHYQFSSKAVRYPGNLSKAKKAAPCQGGRSGSEGTLTVRWLILRNTFGMNGRMRLRLNLTLMTVEQI